MTSSAYANADSTQVSGPPTMKEVAARAGVSAMTVSRVLHEDPRVLPNTRRMVLTAIDELGYRRNELARSLRVGRTTGMVGLVITNLANPFYSQLALGVESVVAGRGLKVVLGNTNDDVDNERQLVGDLVARRVDGIIVVPAGRDQTHLAPAAVNGTPVVLCARPPIDISADCVLLDDLGGARAAVEWLLRGGHRRIGFLGPPAVWTSAERLRGFHDTMAEAGIAVEPRFVRSDQRDVAAAEKAATELLGMPDAPTAFFCANSRNTLGVYRAMRHLRTEVTVAGFDQFELADMLEMPLAVVAYDTEEMGREAARMLIARMDAGAATSEPARRVVVPTKLVAFDAAH
jgi:LacI family transcriptional regulator